MPRNRAVFSNIGALRAQNAAIARDSRVPYAVIITLVDAPPVVLVVEDHATVRDPLVRFLEMRQYTVVAAETANEGLDGIRTHSLVRRPSSTCDCGKAPAAM